MLKFPKNNLFEIGTKFNNLKQLWWILLKPLCSNVITGRRACAVAVCFYFAGD